jgi:hypothetical protein
MAAVHAQRPRPPFAAFRMLAVKNGVMNAHADSSADTIASQPSHALSARVWKITFATPKKKTENTPPPNAVSIAEATYSVGTVLACPGLLLSPAAAVSASAVRTSTEPATPPISTITEPCPGGPSASRNRVHRAARNHKNSATPTAVSKVAIRIAFRFSANQAGANWALPTFGNAGSPVGLVARKAMNAITNMTAASTPIPAPLSGDLAGLPR